VLRDSLHQPQYVEKLEKILRFVIKEKALTMQDLDNIWAAQVHCNTLFKYPPKSMNYYLRIENAEGYVLFINLFVCVLLALLKKY